LIHSHTEKHKMPQLVAENLTKEQFELHKQFSMSSSADNEKSKTIALQQEEQNQEISRIDQFVINASDTFVEKPIRTFCSYMAFITLIVVIVIATGNMANSEDSDYDWDVVDDKYTTNYDMLVNLQDRSDLIVTDVDTRTVALSDLSMIVTYEHTKTTDIFTAANLQRMCTVEAKWFSDSEYADYCPVDS
jgi:hypothetical protein